MPRPAAPILLALLMLLAALPPQAAAAPLVPGVIHGSGTAATFRMFGGGAALEGGAADWTLVCGGCNLRVLLTAIEPTLVVVQDGRSESLPPGLYDFNGFRGLVMIQEEAPGRFFIVIEGAGTFARVTS